MIDVAIQNQQASIDTLRSLSRDLQQKGVRSALRASAVPLVVAMKAAAPDDPRTTGSRLEQSINRTIAKPGRKVKTGRGDRIVKQEGEEIAILVGPNKGVSKQKVGYIGWFTEKGTKPHTLESKKIRRISKALGRKSSMHPGSRAQHWMENAFSASQGQVESLFYSNLEKWIAKHGR